MPHLDYPTIALIYPPNEDTPTNDTIYIQVEISTDEGFAERTKITMLAGGAMGGRFAESVSRAYVYFKGAYLEKYVNIHVVGRPFGEPYTLIGYPSAGVDLFVANRSRNLPMAWSFSATKFLNGDSVDLEWLTQGDYYPTLVIIFKNGTHAIQDYPQYRLHIEPYSTLESEETGIRFYWIGGIAIAAIALMQETLNAVSKLRKPRIRPLIRRLWSRLRGKNVTYTPDNAGYDEY